MKTNAIVSFCSAGVALVATLTGQAQHESVKEGTWRGVFTVNERQVPFNRSGGPVRVADRRGV